MHSDNRRPTITLPRSEWEKAVRDTAIANKLDPRTLTRFAAEGHLVEIDTGSDGHDCYFVVGPNEGDDPIEYALSEQSLWAAGDEYLDRDGAPCEFEDWIRERKWWGRIVLCGE